MMLFTASEHTFKTRLLALYMTFVFDPKNPQIDMILVHFFKGASECIFITNLEFDMTYTLRETKDMGIGKSAYFCTEQHPNVGVLTKKTT